MVTVCSCVHAVIAPACVDWINMEKPALLMTSQRRLVSGLADGTSEKIRRRGWCRPSAEVDEIVGAVRKGAQPINNATF